MVQLRIQAKQMKDEGKYNEAIILYKQLTLKEEDKWVSWEFAYCLKQVGELDEAIVICKETYNRDHNFLYNNNLLGWLLYEKYFKTLQDDYSYEEVSKLYDIALYIPNIITQDDKSAYSNIILRMLKILKNSTSNNNDRIFELLNLLDYDKLSSEPKTFTQMGREKEYHSDKEMYFSYKTKVLHSKGLHSECVSCCDIALAELENFHHDNEIWFKVRRALSIGEIADFDESLKQLLQILIIKPHWIIMTELARTYVKVGDEKNSLLYYSKAIITNEPIKMKVAILMEIMMLLENMKEHSWRELHGCMLYKIRDKEGWSIKQDLDTLYKNSELTNLNEYQIHKKLKEYWINNIHNLSTSYNGIVTKVHSNGKFGFIKSSANSYYFQMKSIVFSNKIKIGDKVRFTLTDSYDSKKDRLSKEASYVIIE